VHSGLCSQVRMGLSQVRLLEENHATRARYWFLLEVLYEVYYSILSHINIQC